MISDATFQKRRFEWTRADMSSLIINGRRWNLIAWGGKKTQGASAVTPGSFWRRCFGSRVPGRYGAIYRVGFGKWNTICCRFRDWARAGVFESIFNAVSDDPDMAMAMVDATIVKVHRSAQGTVEGKRKHPGDGFA